MKWKLTFRFISTIISVVIIVVFINIVAIIGITMKSNYNKSSNNLLSELDAEDFTRNFEKCIGIFDDKIGMDEKGKKLLDSKGIWFQILDEQGKEVYSYKRPSKVPLKYTPFQIVNAYKYEGGVGTAETIFLGEKNINNVKYSYIIGFPMKEVEKQIFVYNIDKMKFLFKNISTFVILIDSIIALFFGYLFSRGLTKPMGNIISGVNKMSQGDYSKVYKPNGIYKEVFYNLNDLNYTLKENEKERKKLENMRQEWIANISHDIKTPLASIKGYAEILGSPEYEFSEEEIKSYANIIDKKSQYIKQLVDDLNLVQKLKNNTSMLNIKEVNLVKLTKDVVIDILNDYKYKDSDINFISRENVILKEVDEVLIKRVIHNLLYNAIIHNSKDVKIEVKIVKSQKVHIFVKDNGKGVKPEEIKYIFERYYRGTNTGESHKGSGLGMAIAKEIVEAHGGEVELRSMLKKGTEIEIIL
ncbi:sensor histidine kinase [Haloimpatiens sp. FM7315]|uniref:sensor histidine kinase n=1 Tax=Haloimpatiens sp. FM7315 TaxID=3298609 RepID=UPI00370B8F91